MAGPSGDASSPIAVINDTQMGVRQWAVVVLMVLLNALDGFDVLASAFAAPGISADWGIDRAALGVVLSAELVGMGFGSVLLGGAADKWGRKYTMIACLVVMAAGMWMAGHATGVPDMFAYRFATGIGIGGMLAATNAVTAETSNNKWRRLSIGVYVAGYPLGAIIGGFAASGNVMNVITFPGILEVFGWQGVFDAGAIVTAALIPVVWLIMPETAAYHAGKGNLAGVNKTLHAFGKPPVSSLPALDTSDSKPRVTDILSNPKLRPVTLLLAFGYAFHTITFYYILKFAVQIVSDYPPGYPAPEAATVLTYANIGGFLGSALFGFVMARMGIRWPTALMLLIGAIGVIWFGMGRDSLSAWQVATMVTGFFTNAAISGYYAAFARGFPAYARGTGTGFVLGIGRLGAAGSPLLAGALFQALGNDQLLTVSIIMAMGSVVSLVLFLLLPERDGDEVVGLTPAGKSG